MTYGQSRVALLLALPPLTVASFLIAGYAPIPRNGTWWPLLNDLQIAALGATLVSCGLWWAIWWPLLERDYRRLAATLAILAFLIGQILVWQPMWQSTDCAQNDVLRCAQTSADLGLWVLGFALTWWGGRRWMEIRRSSRSLALAHTKGRHHMSPSSVRLAVGFALIPLLPGVFFIFGYALEHFFSINLEDHLAWSYAVCAMLAVIVWLLVWRRVVVWTPKRRLRTAALAAMMLAAPFATMLPKFGVELMDITVAMSPFLALAAWFAGTAYAWRLAPGEMPMTERGANPMLVTGGIGPETQVSVPCGNCDYDLRGLREARCPECGWTTTLDALVRRAVAMCATAHD